MESQAYYFSHFKPIPNFSVASLLNPFSRMPKLPQILAVPAKAPLYGSSRLGSRKERVCMTCTTATLPAELQGVSYVIRGEKSYELSNHLGNVLAVVSDRREAGSCTDSLVDFYYADGRSVSDYYPFGMAMDSRTQSAGRLQVGV
jgi:hypothetical protein